MRIKSGFILREVNGMQVAVAVGDRALEFNGIITLNDTGAFIWNCLEQETAKEEIVDKMLQAYDTDFETASAGVEKILLKLKDAGILDEE